MAKLLQDAEPSAVWLSCQGYVREDTGLHPSDTCWDFIIIIKFNDRHSEVKGGG